MTLKPLLDHVPSPDNKELRDAMLRRIADAEEDDYLTLENPPTAAEQLAEIVPPPVRRPGRPRKY